MSNTDREVIAELRVVLTRQRYSPVVAGNYCTYARAFLDYLARRGVEITDVTEAQVAQYLRHAIALFRKPMADLRGRARTRSRAMESAHCRGLRRTSGRPRCDLRSAADTRPGFAKSAALPSPASSRCCGGTALLGSLNAVAPKA